MNTLKIFLIGLLFSSALLASILIFRPTRAMVPPPASHIWLFWNRGGADSKTVIVKVEWSEGARTENVTLKTILKDVSH